ncbi:MAG TPA: response regulator transcription factor [Candidatus Limnocylindrales bacterium]|nr:response regulator transcription factor [Candidatus Limnocylindrales bacterium]
MRVLVVDDEPDVRSLVGSALEFSPVEVELIEAGDGDEALRLVRETGPDIVILDLALPSRDGFSVLEELRRTSMIPVIVLTARGMEEDKIRGLELGADDYMTKPFSPRELVARIQTVMRRGAPTVRRPGNIERGGLRIELGARQVFRGADELRLTPTEFNLLVELASNAGQALTHEELLAKVWGPEYRTEGHYLKVYIGRLRDKVETDPASPRLIQTVRGVGYRFAFTKD